MAGEVEGLLLHLIHGQRLVGAQRRANPDSQYWKNIGIIIGNAHFVKSIIAQMRRSGCGWRAALAQVEAVHCARLERFVDHEVRDFSIDLHGACRFLSELGRPGG